MKRIYKFCNKFLCFCNRDNNKYYRHASNYGMSEKKLLTKLLMLSIKDK